MRERSADGGSYRKPDKRLSNVGISYILERRRTSLGSARLPNSLIFLGAVTAGIDIA